MKKKNCLYIVKEKKPNRSCTKIHSVTWKIVWLRISPSFHYCLCVGFLRLDPDCTMFWASMAAWSSSVIFFFLLLPCNWRFVCGDKLAWDLFLSCFWGVLWEFGAEPASALSGVVGCTILSTSGGISTSSGNPPVVCEGSLISSACSAWPSSAGSMTFGTGSGSIASNAISVWVGAEIDCDWDCRTCNVALRTSYSGYLSFGPLQPLS